MILEVCRIASAKFTTYQDKTKPLKEHRKQQCVLEATMRIVSKNQYHRRRAHEVALYMSANLLLNNNGLEMVGKVAIGGSRHSHSVMTVRTRHWIVTRCYWYQNIGLISLGQWVQKTTAIQVERRVPASSNCLRIER